MVTCSRASAVSAALARVQRPVISTEEWPRRLVLEDVITHPYSSISEVHQRPGFAQSRVSASVARLNERGLLVTAADPAMRGAPGSGWERTRWPRSPAARAAGLTT